MRRHAVFAIGVAACAWDLFKVFVLRQPVAPPAWVKEAVALTEPPHVEDDFVEQWRSLVNGVGGAR